MLAAGDIGENAASALKEGKRGAVESPKGQALRSGALAANADNRLGIGEDNTKLQNCFAVSHPALDRREPPEDDLRTTGTNA